MTKKKLKEKEMSFVALEKDFESKLQKQEEEKLKQLRKAKEEQQNLINQLNSASGVITGLVQELKNAKRIIEETEGKLAEAGEEKKTLEKKLKEKLDFIGVLEDKLKLLAVERKGKEDIAFDYESQLRSQHIQSQSLKIAIIGFGNFGQFLAKTFVWHGHTILAHSRSDYSAIASYLGTHFFHDLDDLCEQHPEVVLLSTSILLTERVLRAIPFQRLKPNMLFVDVLSVKEVPRDRLIKYLPNEFDILCTHPIFGPESGKDSWLGLPFVFDKVRIGNAEGRMSRCDRFLDIFANEGWRMVEMSYAKHDKYAAGSQFVTHTMGRVLEKFGLESSPINTKGYQTLLDLVKNTVGDSHDLYYGLFKHNNKNSMEQLERLYMAFVAVIRDFHRVHREQLFGSGLEGLWRRGLLCKSCFTMVLLSLWNFVKKKKN